MKCIFNILNFLFLLPTISFAEDIRDVRAPVAFPVNYVLLFTVIGIIILGSVVLLIYFLKRQYKRKSEKPVKKISPWEYAYTKLQALLNDDLLSKGRFNEFYLRLSEIVRQYFEGQFNIKAPEMTSEEFLLYMKNSDLLNESQKGALRDFLVHCDMVKFAKYLPTVDEGKKSVEIAKRLIEETKTENKDYE